MCVTGNVGTVIVGWVDGVAIAGAAGCNVGVSVAPASVGSIETQLLQRTVHRLLTNMLSHSLLPNTLQISSSGTPLQVVMRGVVVGDLAVTPSWEGEIEG